MKKVLGLLLVLTIFATPVSRIALASSLCLAWLLWERCSRILSAQQKLRPVRIRVLSRKNRAVKHD
jgi:hypothetical protein